jgi:hypothetical protein
MGAIYCEPCIAARLQGGAPTGQPVVPVAVVPGAPSPGLAALLGFIPGVGAMYNGQFRKALLHIVIFVLLVAAAHEISGLFGLLIAFFIFYMAFEAHQTAQARQLGRPMPDPLGLEHLFGIQENQAPPSVSGGTPTAPGVPPQDSSQVPPRANVPVSAIVLLGLGVFFLLVNLDLLHLHRTWPLLLIGLGLWLAYKRTAERV